MPASSQRARASTAIQRQARAGRRPAARVRTLAGTLLITRQAHFNSAHRLHNPAKSQKWNAVQFGLCTNPHWHGHSYVLELTIRGQPDPETGYVMDLGALKQILHEAVVDKCDHKNLN